MICRKESGELSPSDQGRYVFESHINSLQKMTSPKEELINQMYWMPIL